MATIVHFIDVGQGDMTLIELSDNQYFVVDCNITQERQNEILQYVANAIGWGTPISKFVCTHRDADHMRGVKILNKYFPIQGIWDSGFKGTTTDSSEYQEYMALRRKVGCVEVERLKYYDYGRTRLRIFSAADERLAGNANAQGIVLKVEHRSVDRQKILASTIITGDSDAATWRYAICKDYNNADLNTSILQAGHHGSISFFDDPADTKNYYIAHMLAMKPAMSIISVGKNSHGHPDPKALEMYENYSSGSSQGNKVFRTDKKGSMKLVLNDDGGWSLTSQR
jgi:competence protein ComEC